MTDQIALCNQTRETSIAELAKWVEPDLRFAAVRAVSGEADQIAGEELD